MFIAHKIKNSLFVFLLVLVSIVGISVLVEYYTEHINIEERLSKKIGRLPDVNYVPEIEKLRKEGKLGEALEIANYVSKHPDMPGYKEAISLKVELDAELNSKFNVAVRFLRGFLTGNPKTGVDAAGSFVSDITVYGDIRDLVIQGMKFVSGKETDGLIVALSAVGLIAELPLLQESINPLLGVIKGLVKIGISPKFYKTLFEVSQKAVKEHKITSELSYILTDFDKVIKNMGITKTAYVLKQVDSAEDLSALAKLAAKVPEESFIVLRNGDKKTFAALKAIEVSPSSERLIKAVARKGTKGAEILGKTYFKVQSFLNKTRWIPRMVKDIKLGRVQVLLKALINSIPGLIYVVWVLVIGSIGWLIKIFYSFVRTIIAKIRKPKEITA